MKNHFNWLGIVAIAAMFASCDPKEKEVTPVAKTKKELLTAGKWQLTESYETYKVNGQEVKDDYYADSKPCDWDDFMIFGIDGILTIDEGQTMCDSNEEQSFTLAWAFHDNETKLILGSGTHPDTVNIDLLDESSLRFSSKYTDDSVEFIFIQALKRIN